MTPVRLKPAAPRSGVKHSTTEPLRSHDVVIAIFDELCHSHEINLFLHSHSFLEFHKSFYDCYCLNIALNHINQEGLPKNVQIDAA